MGLNKRIEKQIALGAVCLLTAFGPAAGACGTAVPVFAQETAAETETREAGAAEAPEETEKPRYEAGSEPLLSGKSDIRDYLRVCLDAGQRTAAFWYEGAREDLQGSEAARMSGALYCRIRIEDDGSSLRCTVEMLPHAGEKILEAFRADDLSGLTERERETLELACRAADDLREQAGLAPLYRAAQVAEEAEDPAEEARGPEKEGPAATGDPAAAEAPAAAEEPAAIEDLGLERLLHDWICDRVEYCAEEPADFDPENAPAYLSAVGALLDGSANCQGYTDAFLLLASLAGYRVSSQSCEDPATGAGHVFNTVQLGGNWYAVDVTNDDNAIRTEDGPRRDYHLFNAGLDVIGEQLSWPEELTVHPIAETSDDRYFYYWDEESGTDGYPRCFEEIDALAAAAVEYGFREKTEKPLLMMWRGHEDRGEALDEALQKVLRDRGRACSYSYCLVLRGGSSFYQIEF